MSIGFIYNVVCSVLSTSNVIQCNLLLVPEYASSMYGRCAWTRITVPSDRQQRTSLCAIMPMDKLVHMYSNDKSFLRVRDVQTECYDQTRATQLARPWKTYLA